MKCKRVVQVLLVLLCLTLLSPALLLAQATNTGTIIGQVTDPSGAAVAGAAVTITDLSTNTPRSTTTNAEGRYAFVNVPPGGYDVTISQKGFRVSKLSKQTVLVGTQLTLNATLQVGVATEVIEITATNSELQTINATVGNTVTGVAIDSLPAIGRDVSTFVTLQPGVMPNGVTAGVIQDQNSFQLDGGQNTNDMDGSMNIYTPSFANDPSGINGGGGPTGVMPTPIDSIEEFKANTTGQTADFNSSAGSQISMSTRRGTDSWHGTVYEYYLDNKAWDANSFDNNRNGKPIPSFHYSRFGVAGGGPIIPKKILGGKTYFFANYQGFRWPNSAADERAVPGPGLRQGLLSFKGVVYNLNPTATTYTGPTMPGTGLVNGTAYPSATAQAACGPVGGPAVSCDPRGLGISPVVAAVWNAMPTSNESNCALSKCDQLAINPGGVNVQGFRNNVSVPQNNDFGVARIDHDFGDKWHFFSSYRYYRSTRATRDQELILAGAPATTSLSNRPQAPWFLVAGLTTNITSNLTNDVHYSYLRNYWAWGTMGGAPQGSAAAPGGTATCNPISACLGLGAAIEPFGESPNQVLAPYNVNAQQTRTRYWDGQDNMFRDDISYLKGNHLFQWGGTYQRNRNLHQRTDNGGGINYYPAYQLGVAGSSGVAPGVSIPTPTGFVGSTANYRRDYAATLGMVSQSQQAFTRSGLNLALNPPLTPAMDSSVIPYYNVYFSDAWRVKPSLTVTYGLAWTLEMPPVEDQGRQVELVDAANQIISVTSYINTRKAQALQGQAYNPQVGFTLVGNSEGGRKYPYDPYYGSFSPRLGVAWNPNYDSGILGSVLGHGKTVVRGGFSILYGRLNGVDLVLVPLLGTGLIQAVSCTPAHSTGACGGSVNPTTAFRVGPTAGGWDGLTAPLPAAAPTLPQPDYPGFNAVSAAQGEALDPHFRPSKSYTFDFTIQRQITPKISVEAGYIGRVLKNEYQPININAVPYMITAGGQSFAKAFAAVDLAYCGGVAGLGSGACIGDGTAPIGDTRTAAQIAAAQTAAIAAASNSPQPFFEAALGGAGSTYCTGFTSCTAAVVQKEGVVNGNLGIQNVWQMFSNLDRAGFTFGRTMLNTPIPGSPFGGAGQLTSGVGVNASVGYGNYNALFLTTKTSDWHGLTSQANFTYGQAMGTGSVIQATSGFTLDDPYFLGRGYTQQPWDRKFVFNTFMVYAPPVYKSQHGLAGHLLGGWSFAPVFVTGSGIAMEANTPNGDAQAFGEGDGISFSSNETAVPIGPYNTGSPSRHNCGGTPCAYPNTNANNFRSPILGFDTGRNAYVLRGMPFWNVDFAIVKKTHITERVSVEFHAMFANILNHMQPSDPNFDLSNAGQWGFLNNNAVVGLGGPFQQTDDVGNGPRHIEFGLRVRF